MVDSQEGEASSSKSLVERLEEAPRNIIDFMTATSKNYLSHMLAVVKSYWPQHNLAPVALGIAIDCSDQDFLGYCKETETIAEEILKNLAEWSTCNSSLDLYKLVLLLYKSLFYPIDVSSEAWSEILG